MTLYYQPQKKHKVFISYYHYDDQYYKGKFEEDFGHLFISKSVEPGDIDSDVSDEYIKRLIQDGYLDDASITVVLVGLKTYCRKHVDWEISATLNKKVGGYSGLMGILLPKIQLTPEGKFLYKDLPARLAGNVKTKYAEIYTWSWITAYESRVKTAIQEAFDNRVTKSDSIDNRRKQLTRDLCS